MAGIIGIFIAAIAGVFVIGWFGSNLLPNKKSIGEVAVESLQIGLTNALGRIEELEKWKRDVELQLSRAKETRPSVMASRGFTGWKRSIEETAKEIPLGE